MKIVPVKEYSKLHTMLSNLGESMGCPIVWVDASSQLDGVHCNGVTFLNRNAGMDLVKSFWHEQFHWIVANNNALANELLSYFRGENGLTKQQLEKYRNDHNRHDLTDENTVWEVLADEFVEVSKRDPMLRKMAGENPSLAQRFVAWIKRMMDRVAEMFHNPDGRFTTKQRDAFVEKFGKLAGSLKDGKGKPLFKTSQNGRKITLANGDSLLSKLLDMVENPLNDIAGIKLSAAWHGSPHEFDKFSLDAIGTGEGAQVHGWGLYFAKEREVSEGYRVRLTPNYRQLKSYEVRVGQGTLEEVDYEDDPGRQMLIEEYCALIDTDQDNRRERVIKAYREYRAEVRKDGDEDYRFDHSEEEDIDWFNKIADEVEPQIRERPGSLLQVEIPDEDVMLDEQKKLGEQTRRVREAIVNYLRKYQNRYTYKQDGDEFVLYDGEREVERYDDEDMVEVAVAENNDSLTEDVNRYFRGDFNELTGKQVYRGFAQLLRGDKEASGKLNELGIKGITYEGGRDGRCYVVFDDDSIEITARFSLNLLKDGKKPVDNSEKVGDNKHKDTSKPGKKLSNNQKTAMFTDIARSIDSYIEEQANSGKDLDNILAELTSEHSSHRQELFKRVRGQIQNLKAYASDSEAKRDKIKAIANKDTSDWTQSAVDTAYQRMIDELQEVLDYGGVLYREIALDRRRNQGVGGTVLSWQSAESQRDNREGVKFSLNLNSNNSEHSGNQGASAMSGMQETSRKWLDGIANTFARKLHLNGDRIITEEREKGQYEDITIKQYLLNSPSRIADKVKSFRLFFNMGDRAMDKLTKLRSDYQRKYDKAMKTVKGKEDRESLFRLLWSGDLEGKEYGELTQEEKDAVKRDAENPNNTTKELREARIQKIMGEADVSHEVADAYLQVRQMMTKAYHMLNNARRQKKTTSERMTEGKLEKLRDNKFVEIVKVHEPEADGKRLVTYSEYGSHEQDYRNVTQAELDRMKQDKAIQVLSAKPVSDHHGGQLSDAFGNPLFDVKTREGIPAVNKRKGYIPHFFHEYMIRVKDKDGNVVGDIIESARTEREAVKIAEEWKKTHELKEGDNIYISPKSMNFEKLGMKEGDYGVLMGDKDFQRMQKSIADNNDMSLEDAKQMLDGSVRLKNRHRFFGNFLQRKGAKGFEQDMEWVLRHYFNSASRYAAMETEFKPKAISLFERLYGSFDKDYNDNALAQYTKEYINDINGTPSTMEKLLNDWFNKSSLYRKFMVPTFGDRAALGMANAITSRVSYMTLGMLNLSSALLNFTQVINIASYLGTGSGTKNLVRYMAKAAKGDFTLAERRILAETGVLNDIGLDSGSGYDKNRGYSGSSFGGLMGRAVKGIDQFGNLSMKLFQAPDMMCRVGAVLSAYTQAISQGKSRDDAIKYAKEINRKANFDYGVNDAPNLFRRGSVLSQLSLQFKKYGFKEMEIVGEMAPALLGGSKTATTKQKAMFWGLYFLTCGLMGIPMLDWLDDLFGEKTGIYPKDKVQKLIMESFGDSPEGKAVASMAMYGLLAGANVNISSRASLADVIPTRVSDLAGPSISKAHSAVADSFAWMFGNGNGAQVLRDFSPGLYNIYAAAQGEAIGNRDRLNTRYVTAMGRILRAVGFKSVDESVPADVQRIIYNEREQTKKEKQRAIDAYLKEPTAENKRRLDELHIKMDSVKKESERKKSDRAGRTESGLTKDEKAKFKRLLDFEK